MTFSTLGLTETLQQAVVDSGYTTPTPIQQQAIPAILSGKDVMAAAQTGTGKTAGFTLPLLQLLGASGKAKSNQARALILTPTRELAAQIQDSIETYGKNENLKSVVVFGGVNINPQMMALRKGADILVATPGRLLDLYQQNAVRFNELEVLVLDEADRMLDMGFIRDIRKILALLPKQRQNLMFSATFSDEIRTLAKTICHQPVEIDVAPRNSTVEAIEQQIYMVGKEFKLPLLAKLLMDTPDQVLVFSRTKHGANNMVKKLSRYDINAAAIHGNKSQAQRTKALANFKDNSIQVLVATDIAARGIDIDQLAMVINFDLPQVAEDYVHRIGRTGRAGASGLAVSLVSEEDNKLLRQIERLIKVKPTRINFDVAALPESKALPEDDRRAPRPVNNNPRKRTRPRQDANKNSDAASGNAQQGRSRRPKNGGRSNTQADGRPAQRRGRNNANERSAQAAPRSAQQARGGQPMSNENRPALQGHNNQPKSNTIWSSLKHLVGSN